ncbi:MAG: class I SAM-dependent methyltransferase, partial [Bacteroidota bacterium]
MKSTDASPSPAAPPPGQADGKREQVAAMFDRIAPRYDLLNRTLSLGIDVRWRKRAIRLLADRLVGPPERLLDVATGTADLAIAAHEALAPTETIGVDPSEGMLAFGREKV